MSIVFTIDISENYQKKLIEELKEINIFVDDRKMKNMVLWHLEEFNDAGELENLYDDYIDRTKHYINFTKYIDMFYDVLNLDRVKTYILEELLEYGSYSEFWEFTNE